MACRGEELVVEDYSPHGEHAKVKNGRRHPSVDKWMWIERKKLESYLQIYDTGKQ